MGEKENKRENHILESPKKCSTHTDIWAFRQALVCIRAMTVVVMRFDHGMEALIGADLPNKSFPKEGYAVGLHSHAGKQTIRVCFFFWRMVAGLRMRSANGPFAACCYGVQCGIKTTTRNRIMSHAHFSATVALRL